MGFGIVRDLIAHAGLEDELPTIFQFSAPFAFQAQQNMALGAPAGQRVRPGK